MRRPDHHNEIELNWLERGWLVYLLGGQKVRVEAGKLGVFWAAIPHQIVEFGEDTDYFVATLPLAWFLQCGLHENLVRPLMQGQLVMETGGEERPLSDGLLFAGWERDLQGTTREIKEIVLLEIEARLRRLASRLPAAGEAPRATRGGRLPQSGLNKVEQMACLIAQRYRDPLTIADISAAVGLHPNYAMALFRQAFGTTLGDYLTHHRLSHAQRLLVTTRDKIVEVAMQSGFNSLSRFNEAFRQACGCTPREYRAHHDEDASGHR